MKVKLREQRSRLQKGYNGLQQNVWRNQHGLPAEQPKGPASDVKAGTIEPSATENAWDRE